MRLLLDTHALIWWQAGGERLPGRARKAIQGGEFEIFVSAVNAFEIALKARLGKLDVSPRLLDTFSADMAEQGFIELPVTTAHALRAGQLDIAHRDPFDRLLIAQALEEGLILVSNEKPFAAAGIARLWD